MTILKFDRKNIFAVFIPAACLFFAGCDAVYGLLDKDGAEEKRLIGEMGAFEFNPKAAEIQRLLRLYGYNPGAVDGMIGGKTRSAIEKFQRDNQLKVTRVVDRATWARLGAFDDNGLVADGELNIPLIQRVLRETGFLGGKVDGKWGPQTKAAVKAFQKAHGLNPDERVGYKTLLALSEYVVVAP